MIGSSLHRIVRALSIVKTALTKSIKARVLYGNDEPKENEIVKDRVAYGIPSDIDPNSIVMGDDLSPSEEIAFMESITDKENKIMENDASDDYIDYSDESYSKYDKPTPVLPKYPDSYRKAIYPGGKNSPTDTALGKKPNIQMIRRWVEDVKLAGKSQRALEQEYNKMYDQDSIPSGWDNTKMNNLVNSIAFVVARKIWYVGRKPSGMSDIEWDRDTRHMRPDEGTYSMGQKGQKYGYQKITDFVGYHKVPENFHNKYIESEYVYSSGEPVTEGIEE